MRVAGRDDVDEGQEGGVDDEAGDPLVRRVRAGVFSVSELERYGSSRRFSPPICTRKPLWPSHQMCMPVSSDDAWISATSSSPETRGSIQSTG